MAQPRRSQRLQSNQAEQLSRSRESCLQRRQAEDVINLGSEATATALPVEPGEQLRGDPNNHPSITPVSGAGQGQAENVTGSGSEPIAEPPTADGSVLIEDPSSATEGSTEEKAISALRISSILARDALSLLEANETPHVKTATGSPASPHALASEVLSRQSPSSPSSAIVEAHSELPEGENALRLDSPEEQAEGYSVSPPMGQLLGEGEARSQSHQTALLPPKKLDLLVCWWLQVFGSLHSLGNKIF